MPSGTTVQQVDLARLVVPLARPVSDAKVLTGRQRPLAEVSVLLAEITDSEGRVGTGISYSKRAGGPGQFAHAVEVAPELLGRDPNDIQALWTHLVWAGASVGRWGLSTQAIAALDIALWDLKARRADLGVAQLIGAHREAVPCYDTTGGFLHLSVEEIVEAALANVERGIGGVKIKVGHPEPGEDLRRVGAVKEALPPGIALMVDANQQWDRSTAARVCAQLDDLGLHWIEEPLDAYDVAGHADLRRRLVTPVASGEMLTSPAEHAALLDAGALDVAQPDAARVGGITPFLEVAGQAAREHLWLAPHFAMELHVHLAATYSGTAWVEHFDWFQPLFEEQLTPHDGLMPVPDGPGLGLTVTDHARSLVVDATTLTQPTPYP